MRKRDRLGDRRQAVPYRHGRAGGPNFGEHGGRLPVITDGSSRDNSLLFDVHDCSRPQHRALCTITAP
ncbi:hypothetical protein VTN96DRAFT_9306 [Rasamsonia emersonii]